MHMAVDSEEEWARLEDIKLKGYILEYTGRGKSVEDVGLAQTRRPLDTKHHYFEIEILDHGEGCLISIGLAIRNYPNQQQLGWHKGSIAYHADDGKIYNGSSFEFPFGPKCYKGDRMGCGILFPTDYDSEAECGLLAEDGDEPHGGKRDDKYHVSDIDNRLVMGGEEEGGLKVKIFFTRNGTTVGQRELVLPKGGFFPTVCMLSCGSTVRVDLRPLTG